MIEIILLRHAQTLQNRSGRIMGDQLDETILDISLLQYEEIRSKIVGIEQVYSSPMHRAFDTAKFVFPNHNVICDDRLSARGCGNVGGLTIDQIQRAYPEAVRQSENGIFIDVAADFGGIEPFDSVVRRAFSFITELNRDGRVSVVTHSMVGCVLQALCSPEPTNRKQIGTRFRTDFAHAYLLKVDPQVIECNFRALTNL